MKVFVKWGKEKYELDLDTTEPPLIFKSQIFALTGVPPDRQKVMGVKGGVLKDEADWASLGIKEGHSFMMIGTAPENLPKPPEIKPEVFDDEVPSLIQQFVTPYSPGLLNLGNTCYMNSALQCMLSVPELRKAIKEYKGAASSFTTVDRSHTLTSSLKELAGQIDNSNHALGPYAFLDILRNCFPQFQQKDESGRFAQQDAEECWSSIMNSLSDKMSNPNNNGLTIQKLFEGEIASSLKCLENENEPVQNETTRFMKMECHITNATSHLLDGLKEGLSEKLEKNSQTLGRTANYQKSSKITRLPFMLNIHFVRFLWKKMAQKKAKILRPVSFPLTLDLFDLCSDELKEKLSVKRALLKKQEDEKLQKERELRLKKANDLDEKKDTDKDKETEKEKEKEMEVEKIETFENETATYELSAVLSHKGRYADSGHYVAWVKNKEGTWLKYDDEQVIPVHPDDIRKLSGSEGGDSHIAYLCVYRSKNI